jgi:hypothetical protein
VSLRRKTEQLAAMIIHPPCHSGVRYFTVFSLPSAIGSAVPIAKESKGPGSTHRQSCLEPDSIGLPSPGDVTILLSEPETDAFVPNRVTRAGWVVAGEHRRSVECPGLSPQCAAASGKAAKKPSWERGDLMKDSF